MTREHDLGRNFVWSRLWTGIIIHAAGVRGESPSSAPKARLRCSVFGRKWPGPPRHSRAEGPGPWLTRDLPRGKNALLATGKSVTNPLWCWQFLVSKVGLFLASAEDRAANWIPLSGKLPDAVAWIRSTKPMGRRSKISAFIRWCAMRDGGSARSNIDESWHYADKKEHSSTRSFSA